MSYYGLSNTELADAIQAAWLLTSRTGSALPTYLATVEHYKALLKEQERRAKERP